MENAFFINLERRPDRRMQFEMELDRMGLKAERFRALTHSFPALGCTMSHLAVLKLAKSRGYPYVVVFEDDFQFLVSRDQYVSIVKQIPADFDVVMLGYYLVEKQPFNNVFGKVMAATTTSAYIAHSRFYDTLIANLEEAVALFKANLTAFDVVSKYIIDQYWRKLQPGSRWYYTLTRVGKQRDGFSDLMGTVVSYDY